jgi:hypothetical protein
MPVAAVGYGWRDYVGCARIVCERSMVAVDFVGGRIRRLGSLRRQPYRSRGVAVGLEAPAS